MAQRRQDTVCRAAKSEFWKASAVRRSSKFGCLVDRAVHVCVWGKVQGYCVLLLRSCKYHSNRIQAVVCTWLKIKVVLE